MSAREDRLTFLRTALAHGTTCTPGLSPPWRPRNEMWLATTTFRRGPSSTTKCAGRACGPGLPACPGYDGPSVICTRCWACSTEEHIARIVSR